MQWSVADLENWEELRPYVDSALFPLYLYGPGEDVPHHAERMTYLMALANAVEQPLKGRILLFPLAYQVTEDGADFRLPPGFRHYFVLRFSGQPCRAAAAGDSGEVHVLTVGMDELDSQLRFEVTADVLRQEVVRIWQAASAAAKADRR